VGAASASEPTGDILLGFMGTVKVLGKLLVSVGVGILLFVVWELWGTGIATQRAQAELADQFERLSDVEVTRERDGKLVYARVPNLGLDPQDPSFRMSIPAIDLNQMVVEGVGVEDLKLGPGHYPQCGGGFAKPLCTDAPQVWPGERGRMIVSGHRTTYGGPFWSLDELAEGDDIIFDTRWGEFTYEVTRQEIVSPNTTNIANPVASRAEVVLTTCNPRFSAAERLLIYGEMVSSNDT
jgi:sortase A